MNKSLPEYFTCSIQNKEVNTNDVISFAPIVDEDSEYLVLETAPGNDSLRAGQYYARKGNRFWKILGQLFHEELSSYSSYESKKEFLKRNHIALWDTLKACQREGSSDSAITNEVANDIDGFLEEHPSIKRIIFNGKKAEKNYPNPRITATLALSTSPANAAFSDDKVIASWKKAFGI